MIISALMVVYVFLMFKKCFLHEENVYNYSYPNEPVTDLGKVKFKDVHEVIFFQLQTNFGHGGSHRTDAKDHRIKLDKTFYENVDVKIEQVNIDMHNTDREQRFKVDDFEVRECTLEDFSKASDPESKKKNIKIYERFKKDVLLCPRAEDLDKLVMENDFSSPQRKHFQIVFSKCNPEALTRKGDTATTCAKDSDMDRYLRHTKVSTWSIVNHLDFSRYGERPTEHVLQNHGIHILNPGSLQVNNVFVRHNELEDKDKWIDVGFIGHIYEFFDIKEFRQYTEKTDGDTLLSVEFVLTTDRRSVRREIYDLLDVLADLGGVQDLLISLVGILLFSMAEQSYYLKFMKNLFKINQTGSGNTSKVSTTDSNGLTTPKLKFGDKFNLWASNYFGNWICKLCWKK